MTCVHGCMAAVCPLLAPTVAAGRPPPKWTVVLAAVLYVGWMTANLWPHPLTLLPASLVAGVAQCIGWAAQIAFMRSLHRDDDDDDDDDRTSTDGGERADVGCGSSEQRRRRECRLSAAFVACFQSSHIWGNLVSSLMLDDRLRDGAAAAPAVADDGHGNSTHLLAADPAYHDDLSSIVGIYCGVYTPCGGVPPAADVWNVWDNPGTQPQDIKGAFRSLILSDLISTA